MNLRANRTRTTKDDERVQVIRVRFGENGPCLVLERDRKDEVWDYCQDWIGKIEISFTTRTRAELAAMREFEG